MLGWDSRWGLEALQAIEIVNMAAANKMIRQLGLWGAAGEWNASVSQTDLEMRLKLRNETVLSFTGMKIVSSRDLMYLSIAL